MLAAPSRKTVDYDALAGIPGPTRNLLFGNALDFAGSRWPWEVCADYARQYGGVTLIWLMRKPALVLNDPDLIGDVLESMNGDFYKAAPSEALEPVITRDSLFITNPPQWQPTRQVNPLSNIDADAWFTSLVEPLRNVLVDGIREWSSQSDPGGVDLYWEMQRLTFATFAQAFWGQRLVEPYFTWFQTLGRMGDRRIKLPLTLLPPISPRFRQHRKLWYDGFEKLVAAARGEPEAGDDLLHATLRHGTDLSDAALAEALATNFFGGVFSCSSTINTALYLLAREPDEAQKLKQALAADLGRDFDFATLSSCEQLDCVLRETMRYLPAVPLYFRSSSKNRTVQLGPHTLPANTQLMISNWWLHRFSGHWAEPEKFLPDRWRDGVAQQNPIGSGHFFPFGRGPRMCIGMPFAVFYMKLALATILSEAEVDLDPAQRYRQSFFFGVMMPKGLRARFR